MTAALFAVAAALGARAAIAAIATRTLGARASGPAPAQRGGQVIGLLEAAVSVLEAQEVAV